MNSDQPQVELFWWEGCPSWQRASEMLREAMTETGLDPDSMSVTHIDTEELAEQRGFVGSPTIRIDGRDIQPPSDQEPRGLTCRVYRLRDGRVSPLPDPLDLREALKQATTGRN